MAIIVNALVSRYASSEEMRILSFTVEDASLTSSYGLMVFVCSRSQFFSDIINNMKFDKNRRQKLASMLDVCSCLVVVMSV